MLSFKIDPLYLSLPSIVPIVFFVLLLSHSLVSFIWIKTVKVYLNLGYNKISRVSQKAFDTLAKLRVLWLDNNQIRSLPDDVFYNCEHLEQINLGANQETVQIIKNLGLRSFFDYYNKLDFLNHLKSLTEKLW